MKVWSWRQAVAKAKLEPITKLVLYTLANYMNEHGSGCYPSLDTIVEDSGAARATVVKHIALAEEAGFIERQKHGYSGQKWARNEYVASFPNEYEIGKNKGSSADEPALEKAVQSSIEGSSIDDEKAVQPLNSNSPENSSINSPEKNISKKLKEKIYPTEFEEFWESWPAIRRCEKPSAFKAWQIAIEKIRHAELMEAVGRYLQTSEAKTGYAPYPAKWLKRERWVEVVGNHALPLTTPPLTLSDIGGDTPQNREFMQILEKLRMRVGDATFKSWFRTLRVSHKNCTALTLSVETRFICTRVNQYHKDVIHAIANEVWPEIASITIEPQ